MCDSQTEKIFGISSTLYAVCAVTARAWRLILTKCHYETFDFSEPAQLSEIYFFQISQPCLDE